LELRPLVVCDVLGYLFEGATERFLQEMKVPDDANGRCCAADMAVDFAASIPWWGYSFRNFINFLETWDKLEVLNVNTFFTNGSRKCRASGAPGQKIPFFLVLCGLRCAAVVLELRAVYGTGAGAVIGTNCYDIRCSDALRENVLKFGGFWVTGNVGPCCCCSCMGRVVSLGRPCGYNYKKAPSPSEIATENI